MAGEGKLQKKVIDFLKVRKDVFFHNNWGNAVLEGGLPDIEMCYKGKYVALELKNPNGSYDMDARQRVVKKKVERAGGIHHKINSYDQFLEIFKSL